MTFRSWWDDRVQDARYAIRAVRASPVTSLSVILTIAIGIGALTSMYGLMNSLLFQPPPHVAEPGQVKRLFFHYQESGEAPHTSSRWYACVPNRVQAEALTIQHVGGYTRFDVPVGAGADAARARAAVVSGGFFPALGTRPELGRMFAADEARPEAGPRLAILSHAFWHQRYGGTPDVLGRALHIRGEQFEIIGVTPRGFRGIEPYDVDLWLPLSAYALSGRRWETDTDLGHVVRLKPNVTPAQADADLSRVLSDVVDEDAGCERSAAAATTARLSVTAGPLVSGLGSDMQWTAEARVVVWLVGVGVGLAGVACANIIGLLHLRALRRRREIAVRLALGATARRLATQFFIEGAMLAVLGGLTAVAVVVWGGTSLNRLLLPNLAVEPVAILEPSMLLLTVACMIGTAGLGGLVPMLHVSAAPLAAMREGGSTTTARHGRLHRAPLVVQTALSLVLLTGAGLFVRSLHNLRSLDLGLDTDNVLVAMIDFAGTNRSGRDVAEFYERALDRVQSLPGVEHASLARSIPMRSARAGSIRPLGRDEPLTGPGGDVTYVNDVAPGFFETTGTQVIEGRDFLPSERDAPVVIVNEATARAGWPERSAVGECVQLEDAGPCTRIVGVVENARRFFVREPAALLFYRPLSRNADDGERALFVRLQANSGDRAAVTGALQALESDLPFVRTQMLGDAFDRQIRPWRLGVAIFTAFGMLALFLSALGLYAALSFSVAQRTHEIGVRVAIGARRSDVIRLVVGDSVRVALAGIIAGMAISLAAGRWIGNLLFDVSPYDPVVIAIVGSSLLATALLAALIPSWRATRVDPVTALRAD
jgi:putative ABC transport system permease protein